MIFMLKDGVMGFDALIFICILDGISEINSYKHSVIKSNYQFFAVQCILLF